VGDPRVALTLVAQWAALPPDIVRRSPIVAITDNYDSLFYEPDAIARSARSSVSKDDANRVYDLVYAELHEGTAGYVRAAQAP
jgi:hypothetical protein